MTTNGDNKCLVAALCDIVGRDITHPAVTALFKTVPGQWSNVTVLEPSLHMIAGINDTLTHGEMLAWLDRAIAYEKSKEGVEALKEHLKDAKSKLEAVA
jgi:hypothetical protein